MRNEGANGEGVAGCGENENRETSARALSEGEIPESIPPMAIYDAV